MLNLFGQGNAQFCDGVSRRSFLKIGALGIGGLTVADLMRAEAQAGADATGKSIINIILSGGPTHLDTFDLKPNAPSDYRGEFNPISTRSPGLEICELFPELAKVGDKFSVIRSITGMNNEHSNVQSDTGWPQKSLQSIGGRPSIGSVMSKVWGTSQITEHGACPTFVDLTGATKYGFLGPMYSAFRPSGDGLRNLTRNRSISLDRLGDRKALLGNLDRLKQQVDTSGKMQAIDSFTQRAVAIITSGELAKALDLNNEDPKVRERYRNQRDRNSDKFLLARRLIEAGVRCVSFNLGGWDTHGKNFQAMHRLLPPLDRALAALISDLDERGRLDDTIIMMSGEFGRTPRINRNAGRDHWSRAAFFFLAGGGMKHGQAIGTTNRLGEVAQDRPVHLQHVFTTVYKQMGIDPDVITLQDPNGRPQYLVDKREGIHELV